MPAGATVLEIRPDGSVVVYDGPALIDGTGVTPIAREAIARAPARGRAPTFATYGHAAAAAKLSPALVEAVGWVESRGNEAARSSKGAIGVMQLMPETAAMLRVDPRQREQNISGGAAYLRQLFDRFNGDLERTLAAYNAGPEAVRKHDGIPPFAETKAYIALVMERLAQTASNTEPRP